jgi:hypothetical protein
LQTVERGSSQAGRANRAMAHRQISLAGPIKRESCHALADPRLANFALVLIASIRWTSRALSHSHYMAALYLCP